ncbi:MAG: murein biosynthesis integral membrane protein MurJ [Phycisphaerae bacterium]|nr:murein biosynthesis integral membrane protein MurJ [Phycisphaerae bacterium]
MDDTPRKAPGFLSHARLIGFITLISRLVGLAREMVGAYYFGANAIWAAWKVAFTIPNLFRKLLGEGALSAAFIPLYAQAVKRQDEKNTYAEGAVPLEIDCNGPPAGALHIDAPVNAGLNSPGDFAAASVNVLVFLLILVTAVGEAILLALMMFAPLRPDHLLTVKLSMIMLPYVLLVCGTAFLSAVLQVHGRFAVAAATSIVLNLCLIAAIVSSARLFDLQNPSGQESAVRWLSWSVLVSGVIQVAMLVPSLHAVGFRFRFMTAIWTPAVRRMLQMTAPVAVGAGVLQIGVLMDKGLAIALSEAPNQSTMHPFGMSLRLPMAEGAAARLDLAQFMYQFPLGVFAIALATAIFPRLAREASAENAPGPRSTLQATNEFRAVLRRGIEAALFLGIPASAGMVLVATPAARLLFQHGQFTSDDARWVALSTAIYSSAIWAFSLLQIINRAYYALHDALTPLKWVVWNLLINLVVEIPLLWTPLRESGMAVGTLVSFTIQSLGMLWLLSRRVGGLGLRSILPGILKMLVATITMTVACLGIAASPIYPAAESKSGWAAQLMLLMTTGAAVYFGACLVLGVNVPGWIRRRA